MYMMMQKGDPYTKLFSTSSERSYTKLFSTSSEVRLMSYILPQLNILCRSLVKPYYTKMMI